MNEYKIMSAIKKRCSWGDACLIFCFFQNEIWDYVTKKRTEEKGFRERLAIREIIQRAIMNMDPENYLENPSLVSDVLLELSNCGDFGEKEEIEELSRLCIKAEENINRLRILVTEKKNEKKDLIKYDDDRLIYLGVDFGKHESQELKIKSIDRGIADRLFRHGIDGDIEHGV